MSKQIYKTLSASLLAVAALASTAAVASTTNYYIVVPVLGKRAPAAPAPVISVALATATLPAGMVGVLYPAVNLNNSLQVTGDPSYNAAQVAWTVPAGALPAGLHLDAGVLSGTPTAQTTGADFTVQATYKLKSGERAYTIVVNGATLQVTSVSAAASHTCAVTTSGGLKCWGYDGTGQLGNDAALTNQPTPVDVLGLTSGVASVATGSNHTCAVTTSGGVKCWGYDALGQLGNDAALTDQPTPVDVIGLTTGVASVSSADNHTCAVTTSGGLKCWGYDSSGQLGNDAALANQPTPVAVLGLASGVASVSTGGTQTCAVTMSGGAKCWGRDLEGQLGNDAEKTSQPTAVDVLGLTSGVANISVGRYHTCAVTTSGGVKCWGYDNSGQLGNDASLTNQTTPVDVLGLAAGVASVTAGVGHTCALMKSGGVKCLGNDGTGQIGNDTALTTQPTPVDVLGLTSGVASVDAGGSHTCAVTTSGGLKCWGRDNFGQLGNDVALTDKPTPVDVQP